MRRGASLRAGARPFHVRPTAVQRWVERARGPRLDRAAWHDSSTAPHRVANHGSPALEARVPQLRRALRAQRELGEFAAAAMRRALLTRGLAAPPSLRTIGRILERRGARDCRHRGRRGSRRPRRAGHVRPGGDSGWPRRARAASSIGGEPMRQEASPCGDTPLKWPPAGRLGWSAVRSTVTPQSSGAMPCAGESHNGNRGFGKSPVGLPSGPMRSVLDVLTLV